VTTCVVLDLDGTLIDSDAFDARLYRGAVCDVLGDVAIRPDWGDYEHVTDAGILAEICRENGLSFDVAEPWVRARFGERVAAYLETGGRCVPTRGAVEWLQRLANDKAFRVGIATGGWGHTAKLKLDHAGFRLGAIPICSCDSAPERVAIMAHCRSLLSGPGPTVYIGDGDWDRRASEALGWQFIGLGERLEGGCDRWATRLSLLGLTDLARA
jgi:phosphoglycolate phosphatase-like HAD superfamily hydrolase